MILWRHGNAAHGKILYSAGALMFSTDENDYRPRCDQATPYIFIRSLFLLPSNGLQLPTYTRYLNTAARWTGATHLNRSLAQITYKLTGDSNPGFPDCESGVLNQCITRTTFQFFSSVFLCIATPHPVFPCLSSIRCEKVKQ